MTNETSKQIERFSYINAFEQEDMQLSISVQRTWRAALEALKTDADAELPG